MTISGSVPPGVLDNFYGGLIQTAKEESVPIIVDTGGKLLSQSEEEQPTMIKPNIQELEQLLGSPVASQQDVISAVQKLHYFGIDYVTVSLGKEWAVMVCNEGVFRGAAPDIPVVNPWAAGTV